MLVAFLLEKSWKSFLVPTYWQFFSLFDHTRTRERSSTLLVSLETSVTMATMSEETRTESKVPIDSETRGLKKRVKQIGATHALQWEILDNKDIKAEEGWEAQLQEFWTSKTCKNFVKMYHISKLWPRECHQSHTRDFACRPWLCNDDHFLHRAEEVWRALFGDRPKSKGLFNYSLLSMVYSELILNQKVDWSTFPTTAEFIFGLQGDKSIFRIYIIPEVLKQRVFWKR